MSTPINDGGPAFPVQTVFNPNSGEPISTGQYWNGNGMSLRDWFAGMALQGILSNLGIIDQNPSGHASGLVKEAYDMADAMLERR